jgi:hypothetical protein
MTATCRHGRTPPCAYCLARIQARHYWEMVRWLNELKRKGRRRAT